MTGTKQNMLPLKEFAGLVKVPYTTLMDWVKGGRIKGAVFKETPVGGYWLVPESAAKELERPRLGRPPKPPSEKKPRAARSARGGGKK
jgi:hypothetical protein